MPDLHLKRFRKATEFYDSVEEILQQDPALYNMPYGVLHGWAQSEKAGHLAPQPLMLALMQGSTCLAAAAHLDPRPLMIFSRRDTPPKTWTGWPPLIRKEAIAPDRVIGTVADVKAWMQLWAPDQNNAPAMVHIAHQLKQVIAPRPSQGNARVARSAEGATIQEWVPRFMQDSFGELNIPGPAPQLIEKAIAKGMYWIWERNDQPVSMASFLRPNPEGIALGLVYTPPEARGKGYASNLVAQMSQFQLDQGKEWLALFTNADNPTSNKIYRNIGYKVVGEIWLANL